MNDTVRHILDPPLGNGTTIFPGKGDVSGTILISHSPLLPFMQVHSGTVDVCTMERSAKVSVDSWEILAEYIRINTLQRIDTTRGSKHDAEIKAKSIGVDVANKVVSKHAGHGNRMLPFTVEHVDVPVGPGSNLQVSMVDRRRAATFDKRVSGKLGVCYSSLFSKAIHNLVDIGVDYDRIKKNVGMHDGNGKVSLIEFWRYVDMP